MLALFALYHSISDWFNAGHGNFLYLVIDLLSKKGNMTHDFSKRVSTDDVISYLQVGFR